ncbi:MAG TPA: RidA family protein [Edaphocola sp.]|nr:RidA family protein [Edaphocola sp.]
MSREVINSPNAPAPIGPYSHSVKFGNMLFVSGQIPFNVERNELVTSGIEDETRQCMENLKAILDTAGYSFNDVLKSTIFITDMQQFGQINEVYGSYFAENPPARETVQVAALPRGVHVEISVIAAK